MCLDYIALVPIINNIDDYSNRLVHSKINKEAAYEYANSVQESLDEVSHAAERYFCTETSYLRYPRI